MNRQEPRGDLPRGSDMDHLSDVELMDRVKAGDLRAFDAVYERHQAAVRRFLFSLTWDDEAAQDLLQETFVRLYQARCRYVPTARLTTFLFRIAKNLYLMHARRRKPREVSLSQPDAAGRPAFVGLRANQRIEPEVHLLEAYRRWRIRRAIDALPNGQKLVFVMAHLEGMRYVEIGDVLGIPEGTVKSRMFAAVKALRIALEEEQP